MANIVRFGITQGTEATARVPIRFSVVGSNPVLPKKVATRLSPKRPRGMNYIQGIRRYKLPYLTLKELGL